MLEGTSLTTSPVHSPERGSLVKRAPPLCMGLHRPARSSTAAQSVKAGSSGLPATTTRNRARLEGKASCGSVDAMLAQTGR